MLYIIRRSFSQAYFIYSEKNTCVWDLIILGHAKVFYTRSIYSRLFVTVLGGKINFLCRELKYTYIIVCFVLIESSILPVRPLYPKDTESMDSLVSCCCLTKSSMAMPFNVDGCRNLLGMRQIVPFSCEPASQPPKPRSSRIAVGSARRNSNKLSTLLQ